MSNLCTNTVSSQLRLAWSRFPFNSHPAIARCTVIRQKQCRQLLEVQHVALATPTASGKTLATTLAYLETRRTDPDATLLCLAPTRALVEQWCQTLASWNPGIAVEWFTGDTPTSDRAALRKRVQILVTTPDMLHRSVLPYHRGWHRFLHALRAVIIDESHTCRGVFGSHVALILRRLQRVASLYNDRSFPFLLATATIGNAAEHAATLIGQDVTTLTQSGAPRGERTIALWQPPEGRSHSDEAAGLMAFFVSHGVRTLLFGQQRQSVERMALQVQDHLPVHLRKKVAAYRAGFLDSKRKEIQRDLSCGELVGVVSTNALELGIDIGELDVVILDGFPGSVASFWQQAGRAGRGTEPSLVILVLRQNALDQYFAAHPSHLFEASSEQAIIDVGNPYILPDHLRCAAHERRLTVTRAISVWRSGAGSRRSPRQQRASGQSRCSLYKPGSGKPGLYYSSQGSFAATAHVR